MLPITEWKVEVPVAELLAAATAKASHHRERATFWSGKAGAIADEDEDDGPVFDSGYAHNDGVIRQKRRQHTRQAEEYERTARFLTRAQAQGIATFPVTPLHMEQFGL